MACDTSILIEQQIYNTTVEVLNEGDTTIIVEEQVANTTIEIVNECNTITIEVFDIAVIDLAGKQYQTATIVDGKVKARWSFFQCVSGFASYEWITNTAPEKVIKYTYSDASHLYRKIVPTLDAIYEDANLTLIYTQKQI